MCGGDFFCPFEIGNRATDPEEAVVGSKRERKAFYRILQKLRGIVFDSEHLEFVRKELSILLALPIQGERVCIPNHFSRFGGRECFSRDGLHVAQRNAGHLHEEVDAVEYRSGEFAPVLADIICRVFADVLRIAEISAGAGVHRADEHERRGICVGSMDAGYADFS